MMFKLHPLPTGGVNTQWRKCRHEMAQPWLGPRELQDSQVQGSTTFRRGGGVAHLLASAVVQVVGRGDERSAVGRAAVSAVR